MKYIKTYENTIETEPQIGDYVIVKSEAIGSLPSIRNKLDLETNIGKIVDISNKVYAYEIEYVKYAAGTAYFRREEIKYFSPNKEDIETILSANKYNL